MKNGGIILTIVIPYYNDGHFTHELLDILNPQVTDEVEVLLIDDGSSCPFKTDYKWCNVVRKQNEGVAIARNLGIDLAKGEYITFMDADDYVPGYYVKVLLDKIRETSPDVIDYSWKNDRETYICQLTSDDQYQRSPAVWTKCLKKSFIGDTRLSLVKDSTEDEDFSRKIGYMEPGDYKHVVIPEIMYIYREQNPQSKFKKFMWGLQHTKRVAYYYEHITKEMTWLIDEIQKEDIDNEVMVYTKQCDFSPEDLKTLKRYCRLRPPEQTWAHILRGEECDFIRKIRQPLKCQICIYSDQVNMVGGITTFIFNFCKTMRNYYDIVFLYNRIDPQKLEKIKTVARCVKYDPQMIVGCDVLMIQRLDDIVPEHVVTKRKVQMIHCLKLPGYKIRQNVTDKVIVSQAAKNSWGDAAADAVVINNLADLEIKKSLMLVSATRINDGDKNGIRQRMFKLADKLNSAGIPFVWLVFSDRPIDKLPKGMYYMKACDNVGDFMEHADYMVQLSPESFSYTVLEALTRGTAVLVNQYAALKELGFKDGKMGYILPDDMEFDVNQLLQVPRFEFYYDNEKIVSHWLTFIGDLKSTDGFYDNEVKVVATIKEYYDLKLDRIVRRGEQLTVSRARADELIYGLKFCEEVL